MNNGKASHEDTKTRRKEMALREAAKTRRGENIPPAS